MIPACGVTGIGAVSAWGYGCGRLWDGLCSNRTAIDTLTRFDPAEYATRIAAQVPPGGAATRAHHSLADRFAIDATVEAMHDAGFADGFGDRCVGIYFGSSTGGMYESETWYERCGREEVRARGISALATQQISAPAEAIARLLRIDGPVETVSSACSSATLAISAALDALRSGRVDVAITGGSDSLCRTTYGGFNSLRSVDTEPSRPFQKSRRGLSLGEGGAVLVLERVDEAKARGRQIQARLLGSGSSCDAHHMTAPEPTGRGAANALQAALRDARVESHEVDFVNSHGTGTELNDLAEYGALESVFGDRVSDIPVTASKASVGHLLGTAGAIEAVITALCLRHQLLHPTPGVGELDERTPVQLVREQVCRRVLRVGVSLNLAFGGVNGALVLGRGDA